MAEGSSNWIELIFVTLVIKGAVLFSFILYPYVFYSWKDSTSLVKVQSRNVIFILSLINHIHN